MREPSELLKTWFTNTPELGLTWWQKPAKNISKCAEPESESVVELYSNNVAH